MRDWRSDELEYTEIFAAVYDHLQRIYPGRFKTAGDVADTTDEEFLRMSGIGPIRLAHLRHVVETAKASKDQRQERFRGRI